jgi:transposase InsO family protein
MPWSETNPMSERVKFVLEWEKRWQACQGGRVDVAELCRVFGVSRDTGYRWLRRYVEANHDVRALEERSRRPRHSPTQVPAEMQDLIVQARKARPRWGPRKLHAWLTDRHPGRQFPSASTFTNILKRNGLTTPKRRGRRRVPPAIQPFSEATAPNGAWCIDFKGHFVTGDGHKCIPMTVVDAHSRYCLRCELVGETSYQWAQRVLDSAFREFGLPAAIRSDNGPPFAANGPAGLSRLAVWLLRLGIRLERIQPGKPQQNGRLERFHGTLAVEAISPPAANPRAQQREFDLFRARYNDERPHEALGNKPPARVYVPSTRRYPCALISLNEVGFGQILPVDARGCVRWNRHTLFISAALAHEHVCVLPAGETTWTVQLGGIELGHFDHERMGRGLRPIARPRRANSVTLHGLNLAGETDR